MARHADDDRGRGIAPWIIVVSVATIAAIAATIAYFVILSRADSGSGTCHRDQTLHIVAGPSSAPAIKRVAEAYNETHPVVRSSCISATVSSLDDATALQRLSGTWTGSLGPEPGLWIPDSAASLAALDSERSDVAAGHGTNPFAWSPVVLAVPKDDVSAVAPLGWADFLTVNHDDGRVTLGDQQLHLRMTSIAAGKASSYALQSALAAKSASAATGDRPISAVDVSDNAGVVIALGAVAGDADNSTPDNLSALVADHTAHAGTAEHTIIDAVPVVEADLVQFNRDTGHSALVAVHPKGFTVGDGLIAAPLASDRTVKASGSDFQSFLKEPAAQQVLANLGWRTQSAQPSNPLPSVDTTVPVTMIPAGGPKIDLALAVTLGQAEAPPPTTEPPTSDTSETPSSEAPPPTTEPDDTTTEPDDTSSEPPPPAVPPADKGPVLTIILDTSAGMDELDGGETLIEWVKQALPEVFDSGLTDRIGLWVYSDAEIYPPTGYPELVPAGPLDSEVDVTIPDPRNPDNPLDSGSTQIVNLTRADALHKVMDAITVTGERWAYGAIMEAVPQAATEGVDGRDSRVLIITSGADDTPGTLRAQVLDAVKAEADTVQLDVIGLGTAVPVDAYTDIAAAGGGQYIPVTDPAKLSKTIIDLLSPEE